MSDAEFRDLFSRFDPSVEPEFVEQLLAEIDNVIGSPEAAQDQPDSAVDARTSADVSTPERAYLVQHADQQMVAPARPRPTRRAISVLVAVAAVIAATVAVAVTRPGAHRQTKPAAPAHVPLPNRGAGGRNTGSPLADITARLQSLGQTEVFTVQTTQPSYLRITALSTFTGTGWSLDDTYRPVDGTLPTADSGANALPADTGTTETVTATVRVSALDSLWLPAPYRPFRVTGVSGLSFSAAAGSIITNKSTSDGLVYTVTSHVPSPTTGELAASGWADRSQPSLRKYLDLPASVPRDLGVLAQQHTQGARNPYQAALMLQDWLRSPPFTYSLDVPADESANALVDFLTRTQAGFSQQFATAFVVLAREIGLPTRVAVGFTQGTPDTQGVYHVTDADAHAWPEVWFNGVGWVAFEPTPGRGSPAPSAQAVTGVPTAQAASAPVATTAAQPQLYWQDAAGIGRANVDGTGIADPLVPNVAAAICGGTVAADRNYVYWTVPRAGGGVARARRDGTGMDQSFITVTSSYVPQCVAVGGGHVYWTAGVLGADGHPGAQFTIGRANLDGTGVQESLISGITPQCLAVDGAHVYWGGGGGAIGRANLDGTGVNKTFISAARGCGLVVDGAHIYWAGGGGIARANLDGTGVNESFIPTPVPGSGVLPCSHDSTYLYWNSGLGAVLGGPLTPTGSIGRARLDGTGAQHDFITGLTSLSGCTIGP
jgi:transglutaminase-like putative cysteine protease